MENIDAEFLLVAAIVEQATYDTHSHNKYGRDCPIDFHHPAMTCAKSFLRKLRAQMREYPNATTIELAEIVMEIIG